MHIINGGQVIPAVLEKALLSLHIDPAKFIKLAPPSVNESTRVVAELTDSITEKFPRCCVVLFGSRARGRHKRFSDYDLGVYAKKGVPFNIFSLMLSCVDDFNETSMHTAYASSCYHN